MPLLTSNITTKVNQNHPTYKFNFPLLHTRESKRFFMLKMLQFHNSILLGLFFWFVALQFIWTKNVMILRSKIIINYSSFVLDVEEMKIYRLAEIRFVISNMSTYFHLSLWQPEYEKKNHIGELLWKKSCKEKYEANYIQLYFWYTWCCSCCSGPIYSWCAFLFCLPRLLDGGIVGPNWKVYKS